MAERKSLKVPLLAEELQAGSDCWRMESHFPLGVWSLIGSLCAGIGNQFVHTQLALIGPSVLKLTNQLLIVKGEHKFERKM